MSQPKLLLARDIMTSRGVVLRPDMSVFKAMPILIKHNITGCPITCSDGRLLGVLSELDCMKVIASDAFHSDDTSSDMQIENFMTKECLTIPTDMGIFRIAQIFFEHTLRRLPVVTDGILVGQVTRGDVLKGIQRMRKMDRPKKKYPDFSWPSTVLQ